MFWIAGNGLSPTTNKYCDFLQLSCVELWTKNATCNVQNYTYTKECAGVWHFDTSPRISDTQQNVQECVIFNISSNIFHNFKDTHHYIVSLWEFCMCSIIRYWRHTTFATSRRKTIWALKQNNRKMLLRVKYLLIWYPIIRSSVFFVIFLTDKLTKTNRDENITSAVWRR